MKKRYLLLCFILVINNLLFSQIVINNSDMPASGDKINVSTALTAGNIDYTLTGTDYTWDFSSLVPLSQTVDTFVTVLSTPIYYYPTFLLSANHALKQSNINLGLLQMSNVYNFYNATNSAYSLVGYAAQISGIPVPLKYNTADRIFKFPLNYGNIDSTTSSATLNIPSLGYFNEVKKRKNIVDGWGTLKTPYGSFPVMRIKSVIYQKDSLFLDTIPIPFPAIVRNITEYKWVGKNFGIPLLEIVETSFGIMPAITTTITYIDSIRNLNPFGIEKVINNENISIYPNPASTEFTITYNLSKAAETDFRIYDITGSEIKILEQGSKNKGINQKTYSIANEKIKQGIYFLKLKFNQITYTRKLVVS